MIRALSTSVLLLLATIVAGCSQEQAEPPPAEPDRLIESCGTVSDSGYCGVFTGMTLAEARAVFPFPLVSVGGEQESSCYLVSPEGRPRDLTFMIVNGKVARIDVFIPKIFTGKGIHVGSTEQEVLQAYGDLAKVFPNKYDDRMHDIVVDTRFFYEFIFETDGSKVLNYRAGVLPPVSYVEGCG
jgi:hypothetical protein